MAGTLLLVHPLRDQRAVLAHTLRAFGYTVSEAEGFTEAKSALAAAPPDVLITAVRLGAYNGLHLVLRGRSARSGMRAIMMAAEPDPVLQREAEELGAEYVVTSGDWIAAVSARIGAALPTESS